MNRSIDQWGRMIFDSEDVIDILLQGKNISGLAIEASPDVEQYNSVCLNRDKLNHMIVSVEIPDLSPKKDSEKRQNTWFIPNSYKNLDVSSKLLSMCNNQKETDRVVIELSMFEERGLIPVLQLMFYLVDQWREQKIVWGVGRGSSVASYCLFLIGIHRIDSLRYDLDITEFLK